MTLVDTSVWVDHLRRGNSRLAALLEGAEVVCHPWIIGELACGHLRQRREILVLLAGLPQAHPVEDREALAFIETHGLAGRGIGWIDVHLLASAMLGRLDIWTLDRALGRAAAGLRLGGRAPRAD